jgi:Flp pilus assembly protein TadD
MNRESDELLREPVDLVKIRPDYAEVWNNLGTALGNPDRHDDAQKNREIALRLKGEKP